MREYFWRNGRKNSQRGVALIIVALFLAAFIGFAALAVDLSHLFGVSNELHNAADAGALAGARFLYNDSGTSLNGGANQIGYDAARANRSEKVPVDVHWPGGNEGDVQRGHWSFATRTFTPNDSLTPFNLWEHATDELDADTDFINAVRVRTRREDTPAASFFARIFGYRNFIVRKEAVAYIGFAGTLQPWEVDQPIAICKQSLLDSEGEYNCNTGRMINSNTGSSTYNTGGWTSFNQPEPCNGAASASDVRPLICGSGNVGTLLFGSEMQTSGGQIDSDFQTLEQCWFSHTGTVPPATPQVPWNMTLPVIDCPDNNVRPCSTVVGAVNVDLLWIQVKSPGTGGAIPAPSAMLDPRPGGTNWVNNSPDETTRWNDFVDHFQLKNYLGQPAVWDQKSIYFLPSCTPHEPTGISGGENFGILAKVPVLVR
jgi:hypothetical protein